MYWFRIAQKQPNSSLAKCYIVPIGIAFYCETLNHGRWALLAARPNHDINGPGFPANAKVPAHAWRPIVCHVGWSWGIGCLNYTRNRLSQLVLTPSLSGAINGISNTFYKWGLVNSSPVVDNEMSICTAWLKWQDNDEQDLNQQDSDTSTLKRFATVSSGAGENDKFMYVN